MAGFHHVEVWIVNLAEAPAESGWLLRELGFEREGEWPEGESWAAGGAYLTLTISPNLSTASHDRRAPGVNHLACKAGAPSRVDAIMARADQHGWQPLYRERYPQARRSRPCLHQRRGSESAG
ncbi:hypothetical protein GCM10010455_18080 [Microbacterium esteraromaticum]